MKHLCVLLGCAFVLSACSEGVTGPDYKFKQAREDGVVAKAAGVEISSEELHNGIQSELFDLEQKIFETKMNNLKAILLQKLMEQDPAKKGLSNDEFLDQHIAKNLKVSDKDIDAFIKERNIPKEQVNAQIKERVRGFLMNEKKQEALEEWLAAKTKKGGIEVFFQKPRRPTFDVQVGNAPILGKEKAPVTIVEFSDFQCPYCSKAADIVHQVKKEFGGKVKIAFKQFPLPFHAQAKAASNAALCAGEQKKEAFWTLHDAFFGNQDKLNRDLFLKQAKSAKLDVDAFEKCLDEKKYYAQIEADIEQGKNLGVKSTPTFFVNGKLVQGAQPFEVFKELIQEEL